MSDESPGVEDEASDAQDSGTSKADNPHLYGGQAVIEGVMMRSADKYAVAVRREDGEIVMGEKGINSFEKAYKIPVVRGNVALLDGLRLGFGSLQFSADVMAQEERERTAKEEGATEGSGGEGDTESEQPTGIGAALMVLTTVIAVVMSIGLFVLLPTWLVDWILGKNFEATTHSGTVWANVVEGGVRLAIMLGYILAISTWKHVRRVFEYHGAEHATINCLESDDDLTLEACTRHSPLHPRCGTAFLLIVIVVKLIIGCFFGWPVWWLRGLIRLAMLPFVAGIAYEAIRWAGRHRDSLFSRILAGPGMLMQYVTTRKPDADQVQVAMYALAAVAPEYDIPADWPPARRLPIPLTAKPEESPEEGADLGEAPAASE